MSHRGNKLINCIIIMYKFTIYIAFVLVLFSCNRDQLKKVKTNPELPNIILVMADDLGYGDVGYNGNTIVKTPNLDVMAREAIRFDRFYAAAPVCSPTRGSCLTGRHPYRYGIPWAGRHPIPGAEITLAEVLKESGYATGHFGKWHLGGLSKSVNQSEFPGGPTPYSPPWKNGFDVSFSTESMMPLYNPYYHVGGEYGSEDYRHLQTVPVEPGQQTGGAPWKNLYWTGPGQFEDENLIGDDSRIIMDRALEFIKKQSIKENSFFAVIWFHAPHTPIVAGNNYRKMYPDQSIKAQHWYGCITAMDEQIGILRNSLIEWDISDNTIVWFCSDNGPSYIHNYNSAGPLRGKKAELYEGGIRVPAILEWPGMFSEPAIINIPVSTSDFFPTLLAMANIENAESSVIDGENIFPVLLHGGKRENLIPFLSPLPDRLKKQTTSDDEQLALIGQQYKLISIDNGITFQLYDLLEDISESVDISGENSEITESMKATLMKWVSDVRNDLNEVSSNK